MEACHAPDIDMTLLNAFKTFEFGVWTTTIEFFGLITLLSSHLECEKESHEALKSIY